MSNIFFRIYLVIFALVTQCLFAQEYPGGLSDGTLDINGNNVPVKIYSTTEIGDLAAFPDRGIKENVLVILNESNFEPLTITMVFLHWQDSRIHNTSFLIRTSN